MDDLNPGVTVVLIGLIVCICALIIVLLTLFIGFGGRRPLIDGGSCFPPEDSELYRAVGAKYESEQDIQRCIVQRRERLIAEGLEGLSTTPILPVAPVFVPAATRPPVRVVEEENIYLPPRPTPAPVRVPVRPPPREEFVSPPREEVIVLPPAVPTPVPPPQAAVVERVRTSDLVPRRPVQHTWFNDVDSDVIDNRPNEIVSYGWRA